MAFSTTCLDCSLSLHLCVHRSSAFTITAHPSKSFSAFLSSSVPFPFSVSLHLSSVLLSLSLSLFLYLSACLLYHLSFLSFSNSPFISLSSVWLSISMSVSPFSSTGIKKSCDTSGLASVYWLFHSVTSRSSWFFICWGIVDCVMHISIQCYGSR